MAIEFHCEHCNHMVRTAAENAGKQGRCPYCNNTVYIPTPSEQIEPLQLAPVDPRDEQERKRLIEESRRLAAQIRAEKDTLPPEVAKPPLPEPEGDFRLEVDVETLIIEYVLAMYAGDLNEAEEYAVEIRRHPERADEVIQRLTMDEIVPRRLGKVPHPVLVGFLRQLREST